MVLWQSNGCPSIFSQWWEIALLFPHGLGRDGQTTVGLKTLHIYFFYLNCFPRRGGFYTKSIWERLYLLEYLKRVECLCDLEMEVWSNLSSVLIGLSSSSLRRVNQTSRGSWQGIRGSNKSCWSGTEIAFLTAQAIVENLIESPFSRYDWWIVIPVWMDSQFLFSDFRNRRAVLRLQNRHQCQKCNSFAWNC